MRLLRLEQLIPKQFGHPGAGGYSPSSRSAHWLGRICGLDLSPGNFVYGYFGIAFDSVYVIGLEFVRSGVSIPFYSGLLYRWL